MAFEWKGEDRIDNSDTKYKEELGNIWERLGKGKLYFFRSWRTGFFNCTFKICRSLQLV